MMNGAFLTTLLQSSSGGARPTVLVVDRNADRRLFLRTSLRERCRVATASTGDEGAAHLRHCPPQAVILGGVPDDKDRAALRAGLCGPEAPATLSLWTREPPTGWADAALRHPFTRETLIQTVDRLLRGERSEEDKGEAADLLLERPRPRR
jgi:CheY-like chemotaxis protein